MPRPRIVLSVDAERDLDVLYDWIARDSGFDRADAILRRIEVALDLIAESPRIGRIRHDLDLEDAPHSFAVFPWLIVYEPLATGQGVAVWRVTGAATCASIFGVQPSPNKRLADWECSSADCSASLHKRERCAIRQFKRDIVRSGGPRLNQRKIRKGIGVCGLGWAFAAAIMLLFQIPAGVVAAPKALTLETLLDRAAIEDMMVDYYTILSSDDHTKIGQYFDDNAELDLEGKVIKGRDAIGKLYNDVRDAKLPPGTPNTTLLSNPRISIDGDTAKMDAIWTAIISDVVTAPPRMIEQGVDHSEFVKKNGRWLITKRVITIYSGR